VPELASVFPGGMMYAARQITCPAVSHTPLVHSVARVETPCIVYLYAGSHRIRRLLSDTGAYQTVALAEYMGKNHATSPLAWHALV
jgi:hypothetical protein